MITADIMMDTTLMLDQPCLYNESSLHKTVNGLVLLKLMVWTKNANKHL